MTAIFPRKRLDGSFSLELRFSVAARLENDVAAWLSNWVVLNHEWVREWRTGKPLVVEETATLKWSNEFAGPPTVLEKNGAWLRLRLDAKSGSTFWKDWVARLVGDLIAAFPQLSFDGAANVE